MYLTEFKKQPPVLNELQKGWLAELTETLHSWREAHDIMEKYPLLHVHQYQQMRRLVYSVVRYWVSNTETSWPVEALTFWLIKEWRSYHVTGKMPV